MLKIQAAQINTIVGDVSGNAKKISEIYNSCEAEILVTPECAISGYQPEDLILRKDFLLQCKEKTEWLVAQTSGKNTAIIIGTPWLDEDGKCYNSAIFAHDGKITEIIKKKILPNNTVFDEKRVFSAGSGGKIINWRAQKIGVLVCEDMWHQESYNDVAGADLVISINASPFERGKLKKRIQAARKLQQNLVYVNQVGGQDDLVYDGASFALNANGEISYLLKSFAEDLSIVSTSEKLGKAYIIDDSFQEVYLACMIGLRDYVLKNGFKTVSLGMSGGIDSALVAAIAVDALGAENVYLYMLPSRFTSQRSLDDAALAASLLGCKLTNIPIDEVTSQTESALAEIFAGKNKDVTEENIQSRTRGMLLMAISNKLGHLVLATGNKSEYAVGYATLYGDMCGAYAPIKDLWKTDVYDLCQWRNSKKPVIPQSILEREPTAELAENQRDQDKLPPYDVLDGILKLYIEQGCSATEIATRGFDANTVAYVLKLVKISEYKRKQSAPGP